jgi:TRAP-type C4-dicarboxylate transport system substrate-binding protein
MEAEMKKLLLFTVACLLIFIVISILLPACTSEKTTPAQSTTAPTATTAVKPIELKYATNRPPTDPQSTAWLSPMLAEIEKRTGGKVKFTVYWSEALGKSTDQYNLVKDGVADMTDFATIYVPGKFVLSDVANLPFASQTPANLVKAMDTLSAEGYFDSMWDEVDWLSWHSTTPYKFLFRTIKPTKYEDLKGLKARAPGGLATECEAAIGLIPVTVATGDAYTAWQTGLVDVWVHPAGVVIKYKFAELPTKAFLDVGLYTMANGANIFNKAKMASLPADVQKTIKETAHEYAAVYLQSGIDTEVDSIKLMKDTGIEVYTWPDSELNKMKAAALPMWDKYVTSLNEKGYDGKKLVSRFSEILKQLGDNPPALK